jgi:hypothetical protein
MKIFNNNTGKIENLPKLIKINNVNKYSNKLTEEELNSVGYYKIFKSIQPDKRYCTFKEIGSVSDGKYNISYETTPRDVEQVKTTMLKTLSESYGKFMERPNVNTSLGFTVNGGRSDIFNFEDGKLFNLPQVKDISGVWHDVEPEDYDTIVTEIKQNGLDMYSEKWSREQEIMSMTTLDECINFEHFPYTIEVLVTDETGEAILDENGNEQYEIITKYKNKCKEL